MLRPPSPHQVLGLGLLALAACGESDTLTQPLTESAPASAPLAALTSNTWTSRAPYPSPPKSEAFGAVRLSAGVVNNSAGQPIVYTFGAADDANCCGVSVVSYNVATNTWSGDPAADEPQVHVFNTNGVGQIGGKLYFSGGYEKLSSFLLITAAAWAYDPARNTLTRTADMPKATADGISAVIDGKLFVLPGTCSGDHYPGPQGCEHPAFRRLFRYNPAANHWVTKRSAPHFHRNGTGGAINGKFYVAGGIDDNHAPVRALDVYDPLTDTWKTLAPLPIGGRNYGAVIQGKLFVIVPTFINGQITHRAYVYNPATNRWNPKAAPRWGHEAVVLVRLNDKPYLLALGGYHSTESGVVVNDSELYTP
jgi:N-acetylneuraminic acid mutarotase